MSKTYYCTRKWLNDENSRSTGSVVCYDGETEFAEGRDRDAFMEIADCGGKIRLHKGSDDSIDDFVTKLTLLRDETDAFINHLVNQDCKQSSNEVDRSTAKESLRFGWSRREEFAKAAMQGLCANVGASQGAGFIRTWSVSIADATIAELNKPQKN